MLEAQRVVTGIFAELLMVKEKHAHCDLLQPDDGADDGRCFHGAQSREPAGRTRRGDFTSS